MSDTPTCAEALRALVAKLDAIFASDAYKGVFSCALVHGCAYNGEDCAEELAAAKKALRAAALEADVPVRYSDPTPATAVWLRVRERMATFNDRPWPAAYVIERAAEAFYALVGASGAPADAIAPGVVSVSEKGEVILEWARERMHVTLCSDINRVTWIVAQREDYQTLVSSELNIRQIASLLWPRA